MSNRVSTTGPASVRMLHMMAGKKQQLLAAGQTHHHALLPLEPCSALDKRLDDLMERLVAWHGIAQDVAHLHAQEHYIAHSRRELWCDQGGD